MNPVYIDESQLATKKRKLQVLVIDARICLLDSLSQAIGKNSDIEVSKASSADKCCPHSSIRFSNARHQPGVHAPDPETFVVDVILYCVGTNQHDSVMRDIAALSAHLTDALVVLVPERAETWAMSLIDSSDIAGIIPASFSISQLVHCLRLVHSGVSFVPTEYAGSHTMGESKDQLSIKLNNKLTPRQREVLQFVLLGKSNKYIAAELSLSESTVKVHVHEVMKRLGATSRTHASYIVNSYYRTNNVVEPPPAIV